ncbi:type II secretion system F family protein [Streptomyces europaeiscabiei]|uniref:type II secretion system F family protein n=1 Tax=Streptomyces europaeiscabiei TaxID=146819 RepID=UPI0029B42788|nr:type II secretion system F family protein [Streptomyces europaeiscabiei]MDX2765240.1 type II secretion system F family protein [Streptomyces europaeiscabiei]
MTISELALIAALFAVLAVVALITVVREIRGRVPDPLKPRRQMVARLQRARADLPTKWQARWRYLVTTASIVTLAVWAYTGWPIHGLLAGATVLGLPFVLNPGTSAQARIERLEALAQWLNHLAGVHTAGIGLPATIRASAKNAPAPIAGSVRALSERLRSGMEAHDAFDLFADEMADGIFDHVVLLFQSHAVYKGPGLADALEAMAVTIHQQAADARDVEADRAKVRKSARMVSIVVLIVVLGCMLNEAWSAWYQTPPGQVVLALLGAGFAWTLIMLRRIARTSPDPRLIEIDKHRTRDIALGYALGAGDAKAQPWASARKVEAR